MIYELKENEYEKVRPLFQGLHLNLVISAVIEGNSQGRIWVDDVINPKTAFMWNKEHCYYLAGYENNDEFNLALEKLITEKITPEAIEHDFLLFKLYYTSDSWENKIDVIFKNKFPVKMDRRFYTFKQLKIADWKDRIPSGFCMKRIDEKLLERTSLKNINKVTNEIKSSWNSVADFLRNGFGFCLLHGDGIVCWCTAEYVSGKKCGIGIETVEEYERQGFATLTASAFVDHCVSNSITPHWDSWNDNLGSIRVAEKVGFEKTLDYTVYFGSFDEFKNLLIKGYHNYQLKRFKESAECYEKAFKIGEAKGRHYYKAACAWALAGERDSAVRNLNKAIDKDWTDIEHMKKDEDLESLHQEKGWKELILRLEKLHESG